MQRVKCLYDLGQEAQYSDEDLDVFTLVWNRHPEDTLADKVIIQQDSKLYMTQKPTKAQEAIGGAMNIILVIVAVAVLFLSTISVFVTISDPSRFSFWQIMLSLTGFGLVLRLFEYFLGGNN